MVQFKIVSGKMAGTERIARHFPFRIGRSSASDLQLEEDGVWDHHLELVLDPAEGYVLNTRPNALACLNGQPFNEIVLRNGDLIEIGALKIRFWLGQTHQYSLGLREGLVWCGLVLIFALEILLIYWLMR
jgi:pSer/pThr/pTyr-binding forkhead associated (FHA) protein